MLSRKQSLHLLRNYSFKSQASKTVDWANSKKPVLQNLKNQTKKAANTINLKAGSFLASQIDKVEHSNFKSGQTNKIDKEEAMDLRKKVELNAKGYGNLQNKGWALNRDDRRPEDGFDIQQW
ncbi:uncharacterized protein KGF55_003863 [Candida pseudojiufengensis]|uniref:uncharacterized protein n=1 Tax=Candida pseudojiufengensis TaxID=497109 RepID=UPI0022253B6B|nr:uncharacterized protein KGF55_003863 [Candida pseudojiufengensis]KAI5961892.1 hypothetical protein KGF55_003863 [Candida pseudojiufengensis]